ncbi:MAG: ATP-binding cassette domain-containing protein, partial [Clostridia bacterium]|nr:ATP-binding cassette domain-containing protein [Clostridia bacterium]
MPEDIEKLKKTLGIAFREPHLLKEALTHRSYAVENKLDYDNQRLEFLGDAVLEIILTDYLFALYPDADEGILTKMRSALAQQDAIARLARRLELGGYMYIGRGNYQFVHWKKMREQTTELLEKLSIPARATQQLATCSLAVQQMVAIARAVDMDCKVLILDEPTSSLDEREVEKLFSLMRELKSRGVGIIFITHFLEQVYEVCDRITVLRNGELVGAYDVKDLPRVQLISKMMGKELDDISHMHNTGTRVARANSVPVFEAVGLSSTAATKAFDFKIDQGEVNGFTGLLGSGRSECVRAIFGADKATGGKVFVNGKPAKIAKPKDAMKLGIGYLPEDRK